MAWRVLAGCVPALGALAGSIWRPRAPLARPGWLDLASNDSIWVPGRSGWLALDALSAPGSPWLANDCPIDTISKKKIDLLIDDPASMLPASLALQRCYMPQI